MELNDNCMPPILTIIGVVGRAMLQTLTPTRQRQSRADNAHLQTAAIESDFFICNTFEIIAAGGKVLLETQPQWQHWRRQRQRLCAHSCGELVEFFILSAATCNFQLNL